MFAHHMGLMMTNDFALFPTHFGIYYSGFRCALGSMEGMNHYTLGINQPKTFWL